LPREEKETQCFLSVYNNYFSVPGAEDARAGGCNAGLKPVPLEKLVGPKFNDTPLDGPPRQYGGAPSTALAIAYSNSDFDIKEYL
jgi:hypothetical protein